MMSKERGVAATPIVRHWCDMPHRKLAAMLVEGLFPAVGLGLLFGDPGDGKTAIVVAIGGHIAAGREAVFGHRLTRRGPVVFLLAEGQAQFNERIAAQADALGVAHRSLPIYRYEDPIDFTDPTVVSRIVEALRPIAPVLIAVDSVISHDRGIAGGQSDTSTQAAAFSGMNTLAQQLDCLVLALDHPGHSDKTRPAGSFAKEAKIDAGWRAKRNKRTGEVELSKFKTKDFHVADGFRLRLSLIGAENGAPIVVASERAPSPEDLNVNDLTSLRVVSRLTETSEGEFGITDGTWLQAGLTEGLTKATYYRAKTRLIEAGFVAQRGTLHSLTESGRGLVSGGLTPVSQDGVRPNTRPRPAHPGVSLTPTGSPIGAVKAETTPGDGLNESQHLSEAA